MMMKFTTANNAVCIDSNDNKAVSVYSDDNKAASTNSDEINVVLDSSSEQSIKSNNNNNNQRGNVCRRYLSKSLRESAVNVQNQSNECNSKFIGVFERSFTLSMNEYYFTLSNYSSNNYNKGSNHGIKYNLQDERTVEHCGFPNNNNESINPLSYQTNHRSMLIISMY